jgi:ketosteroid isomerase-like protein
MSEESSTPDLVELTRRALEPANRRDLEATASFYAPDAVWDMSPMGLGTYEGLAAIRGFFEDWIDAYEEFENEPEEILDLGNGVIFVVIHQNALLVGSTGHVQWRYASVAIWVEGMIAWNANYPDIDEARAAAERLAKERG